MLIYRPSRDDIVEAAKKQVHQAKPDAIHVVVVSPFIVLLLP
jgi:hypothetical protein